MTNVKVRLPPSSAARRVACPGSRALEVIYDTGEQSQSAREAESAHWVAAQWAHPETKLCLPLHAPNGDLITEEMKDGAIIYRDTIWEFWVNWLSCADTLISGRRADPLEFHIEERIDISTIHPECWGTPDLWLYHKGIGLVVLDYKFGHGFVEVFENWQLLEYAAGILSHLRTSGINVDHIPVTFVVVQPRSYHRDGHVRRWVLRASDLEPYFAILRDKESQAAQASASCHPSPECRYCVASHACEALQRSALSAVDMAVMNTPFGLTAEQTGHELKSLNRAVTLLQARIDGLSEQAISMLHKGERIPGYGLEQSFGRKVWEVPVEQVFAMGEMFGKDLKKPDVALTPAQAEKLGVPKEVIETMSRTPVGGMKLAEVNTHKIFGGGK